MTRGARARPPGPHGRQRPGREDALDQRARAFRSARRQQGAPGAAARQQQARAQAALAGIARSKSQSTSTGRGLAARSRPRGNEQSRRRASFRPTTPRPRSTSIDALKAENEFSRRAAVEILNEIGTTHSIKYLLEAVADEDWWVRSRASDALARIGGPRVVDAVLELIKDKDENIRRAAIEILERLPRQARRRPADRGDQGQGLVGQRACGRRARRARRLEGAAGVARHDARRTTAPCRSRSPPSASSAISRSSTRCCRTCSGRRKKSASRRSPPSRSSPASSRRKPCARTSSRAPRAPTKPSSVR